MANEDVFEFTDVEPDAVAPRAPVDDDSRVTAVVDRSRGRVAAWADDVPLDVVDRNAVKLPGRVDGRSLGGGEPLFAKTYDASQLVGIQPAAAALVAGLDVDTLVGDRR